MPAPEQVALADDGAAPIEPASEPPPETAPEEPAPGEPADERELAKRGTRPIDATLLWDPKGPRDVAFVSDLPDRGGGIYIVVAHGKPLYVGGAGSFLARWRGRLMAMYQVGVIGWDPRARRTAGAAPPSPLKVWFGTLTPNDDATRKVVEHAVIRTLIHGGVVTKAQLRNEKSVKEFDIVGAIVVRNLLPEAAWRTPIHGKPNTCYTSNTLRVVPGVSCFPQGPGAGSAPRAGRYELFAERPR
jgi:hypothetical protein